MRFLVRFAMLMVAVLGVSLAFAWVWDRNEAGVLPSGQTAEAAGSFSRAEAGQSVAATLAAASAPQRP